MGERVRLKLEEKFEHALADGDRDYGLEWKPGCAVFVSCKAEGFQEGIVESCTDGSLSVRLLSGEVISTKSSELTLRNTAVAYTSVADLTHLTPLCLPAVLRCLIIRFYENLIYTRAGSALVALNPFTEVAGLYTEDVINNYHSRTSLSQKSPHIYEVAEAAYRRGCRDKRNQSIIVSGESGAGKTVSARHMLNYLVKVSSTHHKSLGSYIEKCVLESSPILEAFGNAVTLRNHNSSRFGKYLELYFNRSGHVVGAKIMTYLLEKTRVFQVAPGERSFHIFDLLTSNQIVEDILRSCSSGEEDKLTTIQGGRGDADSLEQVQLSLKRIGLDEATLKHLYKVLVAIQQLPSLMFEDIECEQGSVLQDDQLGTLETIATLLQVDAGQLEKSLVTRRITTNASRRHSVFYKPCSSKEASNRANCWAAYIYSRVFDWLVMFINSHIKATTDHDFTIGLLDIYGFESFSSNSLEQLCINYANERLQQHFVAHFLRDLQEEYLREGVPWNFTQFTDNIKCVQMLDGIPGVFAILNEECSLNRAISDQSLQHRVEEAAGSCGYLVVSKRGCNSSFTIKHYAENVTYQISGMLEKNKDNTPLELLQLLNSSHNPLVKSLTPADDLHPATSRKRKTVLSKFKASLDSLILTLDDTEPHYVRCIKPHRSGVPGETQGAYIMEQLQSCGVVQSVNISKQAFAARLSYADFLYRYGLLLRHLPSSVKVKSSNKENRPPPPVPPRATPCGKGTPGRTPGSKYRRRVVLGSCDYAQSSCLTILKGVFSDSASYVLESQLGNSKVFFRDGQLEKLECLRYERLNVCAKVIQRAWKTYQQKRDEKLTTIQRVIRMFLQRREFVHQQQAAQVLQRNFREYLDKLAHEKQREKERVSSESKESSEENGGEHAWTVGGSGAGAQTGASLTAGACETEASAQWMTDPDGRKSVETETYSKTLCSRLTPNRLLSPSIRSPLASHRVIRFGSPQSPAMSCRYDITMMLGLTRLFEAHMTRHGPNKDVSQFINESELLDQDSLYASGYFPYLQGGVKLQWWYSLPNIVYLEHTAGIISKRRLPKVKIRFHTRPNPLLTCAHFVNRQELQCSLTDCLPYYDA